MAEETFESLARDITASVQVARRDVRAVVFKGAMNVKNDAQAAMRGSRHFRGYQRTIDFDITSERAAVEAEIGPNISKGAVARFDNLLEFGSSTFGPLRPHMTPAFEAEAPRFVKAMEDLAEGLL